MHTPLTVKANGSPASACILAIGYNLKFMWTGCEIAEVVLHSTLTQSGATAINFAASELYMPFGRPSEIYQTLWYIVFSCSIFTIK